MARFTCIAAATLVAVSIHAQELARPRIGLVLSGGGARGAAHIGVIQVLEELRIPIDCVVGTSMGAIIGGLYAAGYSPEQMERIVADADWPSILSDAPPRDELWFRRRQDNRRFLVDLELGWRDGAPALPPGLILGRNVEGFLEQLTLPVAGVPDFDDLRIPFRCVATDIQDGSAVVFESGNLAKAIRASMSIPGVFAPVIHEGRFLVDGGVVDNVPVEVARRLGADLVIVVDISTPLADPATLRSLLSVSDQVVGILMATNRTRSMSSLRETDIGMVPELGDLGAMDFLRAAEAIVIGRETADRNRERLASLSVDAAAWSVWLASQRMADPEPPTIGALRIDNRSGLADEVIAAFTTLREGEALDRDALRRTREQLAGLGLFERIDIKVEPRAESPGEVDVVVTPVEKDWGPNYLRFGLAASSDLRGNGEFGLGVQHTMTPVNRLGGEWRNEVSIGTGTRLYSEFYQPLDDGLRWFVAPAIEFEQRNLPLIIERQKIAQINAEATEASLSLGRNLGSWGEARVGYGWVVGELRPEIAIPGLFPDQVDFEEGRLRAQLIVDTLDSPKFPREGLVGGANWTFQDEAVGSDSRKSIFAASFGSPVSFGDLTVFPNLEGGTTLEGESPVLGDFFLGGFQRLSGFEPLELSGNHYLLGVVQAYLQLSDRTTQFDTATYVGASIEVGGIWQRRKAVALDDLLIGGSVFVAVDSFVGPAYVALGLAEGGERAAYVFIGPTF
jgi:NTE family protein